MGVFSRKIGVSQVNDPPNSKSNSSTSKIDLILLPGLGATPALLDPQRSFFPNLKTPTWPSHEGCKSLIDFAERCAEHWSSGDSPILPSDRPYVIGGVSFGGQVALEIAFAMVQQVRPTPAAVLMISSCRGADAVGNRFRWQQALGNRLPTFLADLILRRVAAPKMIRDEQLSAADARIIRRMADSMDWDFLRWSAKACANWDRVAEEIDQLSTPVHQIHGAVDRVIKPPTSRDATLLFRGKHLIHMTHRDEVNRWIQAILDDIETKIRQQKHTK